MAIGHFWNDANFEVKRAYRWQVQFGVGGGGAYQTFFAKKVSKPSFSIGETTHNYLNHKFYYPGQVTWNDVTLTLVDPVGPGKDQSQGLMAMLGKSGYVYPKVSGQNGRQTVSKKKSVQAIGDVKIQQLAGDQGSTGIDNAGPSNSITDQWILVNPWIKEVKFGDLDYSSEDMVLIDITFKYDYAEHHMGAGTS